MQTLPSVPVPKSWAPHDVVVTGVVDPETTGRLNFGCALYTLPSSSVKSAA